MKKKIAIIGAGPGGYSAALHASRLGAEVTLVEQGKIGGVCLNWGCIPSKVLKNTADILGKAKKAELFGITGVENPQVDLPQLIGRQESVIATLAKGIDAHLQNAKVARLSGQGTVSGPGLLKVRQEDGREVDLIWDKLIVAAGSKPLELANLPFDGSTILSSNELLKLRSVPESLVIVGGGVIGCEFAFILNSFGCKVTVVEALDRLLPLPSIDRECSRVLARQMKKKGIVFKCNSVVASASSNDGQVDVVVLAAGADLSGKTAEATTLSVDKVAVCVGRQSNAEQLGLDTLRVTLDERGWLPVNDQMQTTHPDVYGIGDILGPSKAMLAHVAVREAFVAASNCLGGQERMEYCFVPSVIFSDPEVGCVGLSEQGAIAVGIEVNTTVLNFRTSAKAHVIDEIDGMAKIVADQKTGRIVGVHLIGPHASDLLGEAVVLVNKGCSVNELAGMIHAHPTLAETLMEAGQMLTRC